MTARKSRSFGYIRDQIFVDDADAKEQLRIIHQYCLDNGLPLLKKAYNDRSKERLERFFARTSGARILRDVREGDHALFSHVGVGFFAYEDLMQTIKLLEDKGAYILVNGS